MRVRGTVMSHLLRVHNVAGVAIVDLHMFPFSDGAARARAVLESWDLETWTAHKGDAALFSIKYGTPGCTA